MNRLFKSDEELMRFKGGFIHKNLISLGMRYMLCSLKYLTLEGRFVVCYYYRFPLLNHFRHHDEISIPLFLLHDMEATVADVRDRMKKVKSCTILHQGLIL